MQIEVNTVGPQGFKFMGHVVDEYISKDMTKEALVNVNPQVPISCKVKHYS